MKERNEYESENNNQGIDGFGVGMLMVCVLLLEKVFQNGFTLKHRT